MNERAVARVLRNIARGEAAAIEKVRAFMGSSLLTEDERRFARERMLTEEISHHVVVGGWERRLAPGLRLTSGFMAAEIRDSRIAKSIGDERLRLAWNLSVIRLTEPMLLKIEDHLRPTLVAINPALAQDLAQVRDEERGHIEFTGSILKRLAVDDPETVRMYRRLSRQSTAIYRTLMHHERVKLHRSMV
jgi:hypothetical protein